MQRATEESKYWDSIAYHKSFSHPFSFEEFGRYVKPIDRVLDYGCGYGRSLNELDARGYINLFGVDFSENMILRGKKEFPKLNLMKNEDTHIPFEDDYFDSVILFAVLTCIPRSQVQKSLIGEIERVLKPQGILYISDLLINNDERNAVRYNKFKNKYGCYGVFELPEGVILRHHSEDWIEELTQLFQRLWYKRFEVTTMNSNKSSAFQYLGRYSKF